MSNRFYFSPSRIRVSARDVKEWHQAVMCKDPPTDAQQLTSRMCSKALADFLPGHVIEISQACESKVTEAMERRQKMQEGLDPRWMKKHEKNWGGGYEQKYLPRVQERNTYLKKAAKRAVAGLKPVVVSGVALLSAGVGASAVLGISLALLAIPVILAAPAGLRALKAGYQGYQELRATARWVTEIMRETARELSRKHGMDEGDAPKPAPSGNNGIAQAAAPIRLTIRQILEERWLSESH